MWKGLLVGLAVGFLAGWFLAPGTPSSPPPRGPVDPQEPPPGTAIPALQPARPAADVPAPVGARFDVATATADQLHDRWNASGDHVTGGTRGDAAERLGAEEGRALLDRARAALRERDGALFAATVRGLARSDGEEADRFLLEVMGDVSLPMPGAVGRFFFEALRDASLPGVAAAARARFDAEQALGREHWWGADGWLHLVAAHGSADDVAWLESVARGARPGQVTARAVEALASSSNRHAVAVFVRLHESGADAAWRDLGTFLNANPDAGTALLDRELERSDAARSSRARRELLAAYARHAPFERLARVEARMLSLQDVVERARVLRVADVLAERGYDVSRLAPLLRGLLDWLGDRRGEADDDTREEILEALEGVRFARTPETLQFLDRVAPDSGAAKEIRAALSSPWK